MSKKVTTESFIEKAKEIHGDKYDYSNVEYINAHSKVCIICPKHGEFLQTSNDHLCGCGCKKCGLETFWDKRDRVTTEIFIERAKAIHGEYYDYSKVEYVGAHEKVCIICKEHGEFWQTPANHLFGKGCKKCGILKNTKNKTKYDLNDFLTNSREIHGDKYDYSKVEYVNLNTEICIICPIHGEFLQKPKKHIGRKQGCPKCGRKKLWDNRGRITTELFIEKAKENHGDKYDYSKVEYINSSTKVCIICPKHGEFWKTPNKHNDMKQGCPICACENNVKENILLNKIKNTFSDLKIIPQYKNFDMLKYQSFDIFIPQYNIAIEYQGKQHFKPVDFFGGEEGFNDTVKRDEKKYKLCKENNIKLFYFTYDKKDIPQKYDKKVFFKENDLIEEIKREMV